MTLCTPVGTRNRAPLDLRISHKTIISQNRWSRSSLVAMTKSQRPTCRAKSRKQILRSLGNPKVGAETYLQLKLRCAIGSRKTYEEAVKELSLFMRHGYELAEKDLQTVLLDDTVEAFRQLDFMDSIAHHAAAQTLCKSAEHVLPKQKRALVSSEFRRASLHFHRQQKRAIESYLTCYPSSIDSLLLDTRLIEGGTKGEKWHRVSSSESFSADILAGTLDTSEENGSEEEKTEMIQLPMDVMNRVFQFLDAPSLASASCVSSDWHSYAKDDMLWESHVRFTFFRGEERSVRKEEASRWEEFRALQGVQPGRVWYSNRAWCELCRKPIWAPASLLENDPLVGMGSEGQGRESISQHKNRHVPYDAKTVIWRVLKRMSGEDGLLTSGLLEDSDDDDGPFQSFFHCINVEEQ